MKNISTILNVVLAVALVILYVLHFSSQSGVTETVTRNSTSDSLTGSGFRVAYIQSDSLTANYQYISDENASLEKRTQEMDNDYRNRAQSLQNEINEYQGNLGNLTIAQAKDIEEGLAKKQQNLGMFQERLRQELIQRQGEISQTLYERVTKVLKVYSEENDIDMVVKFDSQSDVLFAGEGLNITEAVVERLNKNYEDLKNGTTQNSDSTNVK